MSGIVPYLSSTAAALVNLHTGPFTVTCWFKPVVFAETYTPTVFFAGPAWSIGLNADGTLTFLINNSIFNVSTTATTVAAVGAGWNFVAVTYDQSTSPGTITIWLNGTPASTTFLNSPAHNYGADSTMSSISPYGDFELGNPATAPSAAPNGFSLNAVGVWATVLSSSSLSALYNTNQGDAYPFLGGPFSLIFQANLVNSTPIPLVICSQDAVYSVAESLTGSIYGAFMNLLFEGTAITPGYTWRADNFSDKVILAQHDNPALYWLPPNASAVLLPGLPSGQNQFDGVCVFQNHVLLWSDDNLTWSDVDDFTCYIPIAATVVSAVLTLTAPFVQPLPNGNVVVQVTAPTAIVSSLSMDSGDLPFSSTEIGTTSQALLSLENTGNAPITVTGITLPNPIGAPAVFTYAFTGGFVLGDAIPVGATQSVIITFAPTQAITYSGSIVVSSSATTGTSVFPISGAGTGYTQVINLSGVLAFGDVVGGRTLTSALVVTNTGNSILNITSLTLPAGFSTTFTVGSVAAGDNIAIPITFSPALLVPPSITPVVYSGTITVNSNATSGVNFINVSGTGFKSIAYATVFVTDNGTCQFPNTAAGGSSSGVITITNTSSNRVLVYAPTAIPGFSFATPASHALLAFESTTIAVTFSPTLPQAYGGGITVPCFLTDNSTPAVGESTIFVTGTGITTGPAIILSGSLGFGSIPFGSSLDALLAVNNPGESTLTITGITYPTYFSGPSSITVAAGATNNYVITFTPPTTGLLQLDFSGEIAGTSNITGDTAVAYPLSGSGIPAFTPELLVADQTVSLVDTTNPNQTYYNYYTVVSMDGTNLSLTLMALTGATPAGNTISPSVPSATVITQFFTVDANEAGSAVVSGSRMNGPIFGIIPQGDYAYIYKERSIQSIQYTGLGNGTFFIHNEISGEGLIGRNALTDSGDGRMFFLGHKELYLYGGGPTLQPVCQQYTRQLYAELDRTRLNQVLLFHNENRKEIWVIYPITGGTFKILIWNYVEDSASIDIYSLPYSLQPSAIGWVDWSGSNGATLNHAPVFGSLDGSLRLHGNVYDREGEAYLTISESMDYDLGAPDNFKYVDVVVLALQMSGTVPALAGSVVNIQVGTQQALSGGAITWSAPFPVLVDGTQPLPVKVNPGGAGRYLRLRFTSNQVGCNWRVSQFEIHCRPGGFY